MLGMNDPDIFVEISSSRFRLLFRRWEPMIRLPGTWAGAGFRMLPIAMLPMVIGP